MKFNKLAIALGATVLSGAAAAEFSANIGATSNYVWRGVTQTDDAAAVSGGLDYAHESGFYAGTWASNVDFDDDTTAEVDVYGGFANQIDVGSGLGYDVGVIYYWYPGGDDINFTEVQGSLSYGPFKGGVNYIVDSDVDDSSDTNDVFVDGDIYYYLGASFDVAETWTIGGTVGYFDFDEDGKNDIDTSYAHYQLDIGKSAGDLGDFTFSISSADGESGDSSTKVFVAWGKTFD
jgi:uncharacterized protein (TIGR02001 family)